MLPTEDKSIIYADQNNAPQLYERYQGIKQGQLMSNQPPRFNNQHLYFTTDEEIKEGDWFIRKIEVSLGIEQYIKGDHLYSGDKKIVATTDESLYKQDYFPDGVKAGMEQLPQPSQAFIEKYCELGGIDEVLVEYNEIATWCDDGKACKCNMPKFCPERRNGIKNILKIDAHNTITIHPVKNSWSKEEVIQLIRTFDMTMGRDITTKAFDNWINKNLKV